MTPVTLDQERSSAWTRRTLMGAAGSGLILATNSHLLPESMAAETAAVDQPLRVQGAGKQRHRRKRRYNHHKKHRHTSDTQAYATVVLPRAQVIPGNTRRTIGFDYVLTSRNFSFVSGASNVLVNHSGQYEFRIFLSLSSSSTSAWTTTLMLNRAGSPSEAFADSYLLTTEPMPIVSTATLHLEKGDEFHLSGQLNSGAQALVSAGTMVITLMS